MTTISSDTDEMARGWDAIRAKLVSDMERQKVLLQQRVDSGYNGRTYSMDAVRAKLELKLVRNQLATQLAITHEVQQEGVDPLLWKLGQ